MCHHCANLLQSNNNDWGSRMQNNKSEPVFGYYFVLDLQCHCDPTLVPAYIRAVFIWRSTQIRDTVLIICSYMLIVLIGRECLRFGVHVCQLNALKFKLLTSANEQKLSKNNANREWTWPKVPQWKTSNRKFECYWVRKLLNTLKYEYIRLDMLKYAIKIHHLHT